jgi:hypothetical protein
MARLHIAFSGWAGVSTSPYSGSITKLALALETMTLEIRKGAVFFETAHSDFKAQVRKLRRLVEDIKTE